jgi:hypothetical protein
MLCPWLVLPVVCQNYKRKVPLVRFLYQKIEANCTDHFIKRVGSYTSQFVSPVKKVAIIVELLVVEFLDQSNDRWKLRQRMLNLSTINKNLTLMASDSEAGSEEGDWLESADPKVSGHQRETYRLHVDSERNGFKCQEIDDPRMPRPLDKLAPLIRLTSLDSVDLVFLTGPEGNEYTILPFFERPKINSRN